METSKKNKLNYILLIDDDADNNFIHKLIIRESGLKVQVEAVVSVKDAIQYLNAGGKPDLIFLDINMPILNGWDFLEQFKNLSINKKEDIKIVMLTSSLNIVDETKARSIKEISDYKNKPLTNEIIKEVCLQFFES